MMQWIGPHILDGVQQEVGVVWQVSILARAASRDQGAPVCLCVYVQGSQNNLTHCADADGVSSRDATFVGALRILIVSQILGSRCSFRGVGRQAFSLWLSGKDAPWALVRGNALQTLSRHDFSEDDCPQEAQNLLRRRCAARNFALMGS